MSSRSAPTATNSGSFSDLSSGSANTSGRKPLMNVPLTDEEVAGFRLQEHSGNALLIDSLPPSSGSYLDLLSRSDGTVIARVGFPFGDVRRTETNMGEHKKELVTFPMPDEIFEIDNTGCSTPKKESTEPTLTEEKANPKKLPTEHKKELVSFPFTGRRLPFTGLECAKTLTGFDEEENAKVERAMEIAIRPILNKLRAKAPMTDKEWKEAIRIDPMRITSMTNVLEEYANKGDSYAQFLLAMSLMSESLNQPDPDARQKILHLYEMSANQGNVHAQLALASHYESGEIVATDLRQAALYYEMAAKQGNPRAQEKLQDPKFAEILKTLAEERKAAEEKSRQEKLQAKQKLAEEKAKEEKERQAKLEKEQKEKIELELKAKLEKEQKEKAELELKTKLAQEQQEKLKADQKLAEEKAKQEQEQQADAKSSTQPQASIGLGSRIANFFAACWNRIRCCTTPQPAADPQEADDDPAELKAATAKLATSVQEMTTIVRRHEEQSGKDAKELQSLREDQAKLAQEVLEGMQRQDAKFAQSMLDSQAEFMQVNRQVRAAHALAESKLSGSQDVMNILTEKQLAVYKAGLEQTFIFRSPNLSDFYYTFRQLLWQNWNAYSIGHSGKVSLSDKRLINYTVDAIDAIGQRIPGVGLLTGIAKRLVELGQSFDLKNAINQIAGFFDPGEETSAQIIDMLARKLTIAQQETIEKLTTQNQGVLRQFSQAFVRFKDAITVNDINTVIRKKSEEQVESLLIAIITGKLTSHPTIRDVPQLFAAILGTEVPYPENLSAEAMATINANTSASTSAVPSAIYFAVPTSAADTVSVSSTLSMSQSYVAPPPPSSTAELLSTLLASSSDVDARAKKAEEEAKKLQAELLRTQEDAKRAQEEAKKAQELLVQLAATQAEQQAEQARQAQLLESLARTSSAAHATAEQAIRATELTSGRVATVEQTAEEAKQKTDAIEHKTDTALTEAERARQSAETATNTARNIHQQMTTLEQETARTRAEAARAKTEAKAAHQALIQSGIRFDSTTSASDNTAQLFFANSPLRGTDPHLAAQIRAQVQAEMAPMAEHIAQRLEAVEGGQPARKRKF